MQILCNWLCTTCLAFRAAQCAPFLSATHKKWNCQQFLFFKLIYIIKANTSFSLTIISFKFIVSDATSLQHIFLIFFFNFSVQDDDGVLHRLPKKNSGYTEVTNGMIPKINVNAEEPGLNCQNPGHQGSVHSLKMDTLECDPCERTGPPMTQRRNQWNLQLSPIISTRPIFVVVLVSRSSNGREIKQKIYDDMRICVKENQR
jgi:hypothetical protein